MAQPNSLQKTNTVIPVIYEDDACIAFNKPPGLLVIPTDKNEQRTLFNLVNQQFPDGFHLHPAHRLDRDTSGIILFAKGKSHQQALMQSFKERKVIKNYIAFVQGRLEPASGKITLAIKDKFAQKFSAKAPAQSALTHYEVEKYYKDFTVVNVMPVTGRTNQIRIHLAQIGHPLVGEDVYAFRKDFALRFKRIALHAWRLQWPNPATGKLTAAQAPLAEDMMEFLKKF